MLEVEVLEVEGLNIEELSECSSCRLGVGRLDVAVG